jgi:ketosteroid isomerase-like protein
MWLQRLENDMRRRDALTAATLLSLTLVVAPHRLLAGDQLEGTQSTEAALDEVRTANEQFWRAFSARDLWAMGRLWAKTENISAIFPAGSTPFVGWENIQESFRRSFAHNRDIRIESHVVGIHAEGGGVAWLVDSVRFEAMQTQTGQPIVMNRMLGSKVFEKSGDKWLLVHFHAHFPGFAIPAETPHGQANEEARVEQPSDDIARASATFYDSFSKRDLEAMARVWAKDKYVSVIHPSNPAPFLGPEEVETSWKHAFSEIGAIHIRPRSVIWHMLGSVAWAVDMTEFHVSSAESSAPIYLRNVLSTQIFEKRRGQWLMVHYHGQIGFSFDHSD